MHGRHATSLLAALTHFLALLFPKTLNLTRTGFRDLVVRSLFYFITFLETEQKPALATLKKKSLLKQGRKNSTQGRFWSKITMTAASCFCSRKEHTLNGEEAPVNLILVQIGWLSSILHMLSTLVLQSCKIQPSQKCPWNKDWMLQTHQTSHVSLQRRWTMDFKKEHSEMEFSCLLRTDVGFLAVTKYGNIRQGGLLDGVCGNTLHYLCNYSIILK